MLAEKKKFSKDHDLTIEVGIIVLDNCCKRFVVPLCEKIANFRLKFVVHLVHNCIGKSSYVGKIA